MIVTTTNDVQSRRVDQHHSLLIGEAIPGLNAVRDVSGGRAAAVGRMAAVRGHRLPT